MNGRVYDPVVGRFVSPDPWIQDAKNSQSFNRYTYVWNNPLRYTDPTGEITTDCGRCSIMNFADNVYAVTRTTETLGWNVTITVTATSAINFVALSPDVGGKKPQTKNGTDHQQKSSTKQAADAGTVQNTSGNLGAGLVAVNAASEVDKGDVTQNELLQIKWKGKVYMVDREMFNEAVNYIRESIPEQAAMADGDSVEYFGRLYRKSGKMIDGIHVSGSKNKLCYGSPKACQGAVKNAVRSNKKPALNPDILTMNVHLHPGTNKNSMLFSESDTSLSTARKIPVFIGNMNGDMGVFMPGMKMRNGRGPVLCRGCAK